MNQELGDSQNLFVVEELIASNQELQSVNEELQKVNIEYQSKIQELIELNNNINGSSRLTMINY